METWVIATVLAAGFQTARFMLQKQLSMGALSTAGATFARFIYSSPLGAAAGGCLSGAARAAAACAVGPVLGLCPAGRAGADPGDDLRGGPVPGAQFRGGDHLQEYRGGADRLCRAGGAGRSGHACGAGRDPAGAGGGAGAVGHTGADGQLDAPSGVAGGGAGAAGRGAVCGVQRGLSGRVAGTGERRSVPAGDGDAGGGHDLADHRDDALAAVARAGADRGRHGRAGAARSGSA